MTVLTAGRLSEPVADTVRDAWDVRGMTADDLARVTGLSILRVENRLSGLAPWELDELHAVAVGLELPAQEFIDWFRE